MSKWIWRKENQSGAAETVYFRYDFQLPSAPVSGTIRFTGDDSYKIFINGHEVRSSNNFKCAPLEAKSTFKAGHNCIAAQVTNYVSAAGLLMFAEFNLAGEDKPRRIVTNGEWKCIVGENENDHSWTVENFSAQAWEDVAEICDVTANNSWRRHVNCEEFMTQEEIVAMRREKEAIKALILGGLDDISRRLEAEEKPSDVRFVREGNLPFLAVGDVKYPSPFYNAFYLDARKDEDFLRLRRFHDAGFRVFLVSIQMRSFWKADGSVDVSDCESKLMHFLAACPNGRLMLSIDLVPPKWFLEANPDECIAYGSGAVPVYDGDELQKPVMRASCASAKWRAQAGEALKRFISGLENTLPGKRIVAYHNQYGIYGEWHSYGMVKDLPDVSQPMRGAFVKYLKDKYGSDDELRLAWHDDGVSLDGAEIPSVDERLMRKDGSFRNDAQDRRVLDFNDCMAEQTTQCQHYFNKTVLEASGRKLPSGNYSGYFFGVGYPSFGWQTRTPETMRSDCMDFQSAPYCYAYRATGQNGLPRGVLESYALNGKTALLESDARPHTATSAVDRASSSQEETDGQLMRDFCNAITRGAALWYYDFNAGWYDAPHYFGMFSKMRDIWSARPDVSRVSQVCILCDFDSVPYHTCEVNPNAFTVRLLGSVCEELGKSGAPYDTLITEDLELDNTPDYRLYVFPNLVHLTEKKRQIIDGLLKRGATVVFLCDIGDLAPLRNQENVIVAKDGFVSRAELRQIYKRLGIHIYTEDSEAVLFACRELIGVHKAAPGETRITLPRKPLKVEQILPEQREFPATQEIIYAHPTAGTALFRIRWDE